MRTPVQVRSTRYKRGDIVVRVLALGALAWGAGYLVWRLADTWQGAQPAMFIVLYACEVFGWRTTRG